MPRASITNRVWFMSRGSHITNRRPSISTMMLIATTVRMPIMAVIEDMATSIAGMLGEATGIVTKPCRFHQGRVMRPFCLAAA